MALHDEGIRFTEEHYATKEDVKRAYNMSMIDSIWDKILLYRSNFLVETNLLSIDYQPFSLTLFTSLNKRLSNIERKIFQLYIRYNKENPVLKESFKESVLLSSLKKVNGGLEEISDDMMLHIIRHDINVLPANVAPLCAYLNTLEFFSTHEANLSVETLLAVNGMVGGETYENSITHSLRTTEIDTPHYFQNNYIYKASPIENLPKLVESYINFLNDEEYSPLLKVIISTFYLDYIKPFDYQLEETSAIMSKIILAKGFDDIGYLLLTESLSFLNQEEIQKAKKIVQETGDLTHFIVQYLDIIEADIEALKNLIDDLKVKFVQEEQYPLEEIPKVKEEIKKEKVVVKTIPSFIYDDDNIPKNLTSQGEVALPVFPTGVEKNAIESIVQNLMEIYPYLKRTQAHFYALHCTIGKHYTIAQFKKEEDVAYETARTSMDFLADNGFYKKSQVRNKFVYTPIPRR